MGGASQALEQRCGFLQPQACQGSSSVYLRDPKAGGPEIRSTQQPRVLRGRVTAELPLQAARGLSTTARVFALQSLLYADMFVSTDFKKHAASASDPCFTGVIGEGNANFKIWIDMKNMNE